MLSEKPSSIYKKVFGHLNAFLRKRISKSNVFFILPVLIALFLFSAFVFGFSSSLKPVLLENCTLLSAGVADKVVSSEESMFAKPNRNFLTGSPQMAFLEQNTLVGMIPPAMADVQTLAAKVGGESERGKIIEYEVKQGETISTIAEDFGVSTNTILWANDISRNSVIQPGQEIIILPTSGTLHLVEKGDTVSTIAEKYEADLEEIISYNELENENDIFIGDVLLVPGGKMPKEPVRVNSAPIAKAYFIFPCEGEISQGAHGAFGNAVDISNSCGRPVVAAASGVVQRAGYISIGGNRITILHSNGVVSYYGHLSVITVAPGQRVNAGDIIGYIGNTGYTIGMTGCHLHFEVRGAGNFLLSYPVGSQLNW